MTPSNIRSSLPLEVLLYLNARFSIVYFISIIGIYLYKLSFLNYPLHVKISEVLIILIFAPIEALRISWMHQGNLTETSAFISFALLLSVAIAGICVYLSVFQGYVLYIELVISCIQGGFVLIESVLGVAAVAVFSRTTQAAHP